MFWDKWHFYCHVYLIELRKICVFVFIENNLDNVIGSTYIIFKIVYLLFVYESYSNVYLINESVNILDFGLSWNKFIKIWFEVDYFF